MLYRQTEFIIVNCKLYFFFLQQKKPDWSKKGDEKKVKEEVEYEA